MENIQGFIALNSYALLLILFISVVFYSKVVFNIMTDSLYLRAS